MRDAEGDFTAGESGQGEDIHLDCRAYSGDGFTSLFVWYNLGLDPEGRDLRTVLEAFVGTRTRKVPDDVQYRDTPVGQESGIEATWLHPNGNRQRAFVFRRSDTELTWVVAAEGAPDEDVFEDVLLPAYLLARQSVRTS